MIKEKRFLYWAIFFTILQILVIIRNSWVDYLTFFWFCDFAPIFFALFFFLKNKQAIKGIINIGLIPQSAYLLGVIVFIAKNTQKIGLSAPNVEHNILYILITILIHLSSILAIYATIEIKTTKKSLIYSLVFTIIIYIVTLLFTPPNDYINYVYNLGPPIFEYLYSLYRVFHWIPMILIVFILPGYLIQKLIYYIRIKN